MLLPNKSMISIFIFSLPEVEYDTVKLFLTGLGNVEISKGLAFELFKLESPSANALEIAV